MTNADFFERVIFVQCCALRRVRGGWEAYAAGDSGHLRSWARGVTPGAALAVLYEEITYGD